MEGNPASGTIKNTSRIFACLTVPFTMSFPKVNFLMQFNLFFFICCEYQLIVHFCTQWTDCVSYLVYVCMLSHVFAYCSFLGVHLISCPAPLVLLIVLNRYNLTTNSHTCCADSRVCLI